MRPSPDSPSCSGVILARSGERPISAATAIPTTTSAPDDQVRVLQAGSRARRTASDENASPASPVAMPAREPVKKQARRISTADEEHDDPLRQRIRIECERRRTQSAPPVADRVDQQPDDHRQHHRQHRREVVVIDERARRRPVRDIAQPVEDRIAAGAHLQQPEERLERPRRSPSRAAAARRGRGPATAPRRSRRAAGAARAIPLRSPTGPPRSPGASQARPVGETVEHRRVLGMPGKQSARARRAAERAAPTDRRGARRAQCASAAAAPGMPRARSRRAPARTGSRPPRARAATAAAHRLPAL